MNCQICGQETTKRITNQYRATDYIWGVCYRCAHRAIESAKTGAHNKKFREEVLALGFQEVTEFDIELN